MHAHRAPKRPDLPRRVLRAQRRRENTESDLRCRLGWCAEHGLRALGAHGPTPGALHTVDTRAPPVKLSTVSRRFSVASGFYRTCVIGGREALVADHDA